MRVVSPTQATDPGKRDIPGDGKKRRVCTRSGRRERETCGERGQKRGNLGKVLRLVLCSGRAPLCTKRLVAGK